MQFSEHESRVLRHLESRFVAGGGFAHVTSDEIVKDNRLQSDQFTRLMARFESLGILEEVTLDGLIAIKGIVCQYVAQLDEGPSPSPATVNILNVGRVSHSQLQQGTVRSEQTSSHGKAEAVESDRVADYNLSSEARTLLIEASKDTNGKVMCSHTMWGQSIQTNGREFVEQGNPRSTAQWTQAVSDLASYGLIEDRWHYGEVYAVTGKGYKVADALKG